MEPIPRDKPPEWINDQRIGNLELINYNKPQLYLDLKTKTRYGGANQDGVLVLAVLLSSWNLKEWSFLYAHTETQEGHNPSDFGYTDMLWSLSMAVGT